MNRWALRAAQAAATVLVTWFIVDRVGLGVDQLRSMDPALFRPEPLLFVVSCAILLVGYLVSGVIWGRMVQDLGGPRLGIGAAVQVYMVANLGRYVPGKLWQIAGMAVLARRRGVPAAVATAAAVMGQAVALGAATLIGLGALAGGPEGLRGRGMLLAGVFILLGSMALLPPVFRRLVSLWFRVARADDVPEVLPSRALGWLALYLVNWALYAVAFWILALSLRLDAPLVAVTSGFAAAYVLGWLALFAPAGLGVREGFLIALLGPHVGAAPAAALAAVARLWTTLVEVIPAAAFWAGGARAVEAAAAPSVRPGVSDE